MKINSQKVEARFRWVIHHPERFFTFIFLSRLCSNSGEKPLFGKTYAGTVRRQPATKGTDLHFVFPRRLSFVVPRRLEISSSADVDQGRDSNPPESFSNISIFFKVARALLNASGDLQTVSCPPPSLKLPWRVWETVLGAADKVHSDV